MTRYRPAPIANPRWHQHTYKPRATVTLAQHERIVPRYISYAVPRWLYTATVRGDGYEFTTLFSSDETLTPADVLARPGVKQIIWGLEHRTQSHPLAA